MNNLKLNKISFLLLFVVANVAFAEDYKLTPQEIEILKKAIPLTQVEPWNTKKEWPSIINDDGTFDYGDKKPRVKQTTIEKKIIPPDTIIIEKPAQKTSK